MSELVGQLIADGRYEILELLGAGAMGEVFRARQVAMGRMVALKLIQGGAIRSVESAARFQREMKLTAKIEHPNTIRVYDFGTWQGQLYLTMELLRGKTLGKELAEEGRFELERIVRIATQITRGLSAAHAEGVVHRDLKPENVMLLELYGERDVVKVLDFGIAKSFDEEDEAKMTGAGAIIGTPAYMSPEQAMGQRVDARSDLYTLGIMLFEMASGQVPFDAPSLTAMLVAHATQEPPVLATVHPAAEPALSVLVGELLKKDPSARPQTAREVEERLAAMLGQPRPLTSERPKLSQQRTKSQLPARSEPPPEAQAPAVKKSSRRLLWLMLLSLLVGAGAAVVLWAHYKTRDGDSAQEKPVPRAAPPPPPTGPPASTSPSEDQKLAAAKEVIREQLSEAGLPSPPTECPAEVALVAAPLLLQARALIASDPAAATAAAVEAVQKCPSWAAAHNVHGNALQTAGKLDDAARAYAEALRLVPDYDAPRFNLGLLQLRRKDDGAIATFSALIEQKPSYPDVYKSRAQAYVFAKRYREGLADLEHSLRQEPDDGTAWLMAGQLREKLKLDGANEAYCKASELEVAAGKERCKR